MFYSQRSLNLHSFGAYTFAYYKSLGIKNWEFEEKVLPVYLKQIMEDKRSLYDLFFGKTINAYDADERIIINKVIDTVEDIVFPTVLFQFEKQRVYKQVASLTLLAIISESYHFADVDEPIQEDDMELFATLLEICNINEFAELSEYFCLRETRKKLEQKIWNRLNVL